MPDNSRRASDEGLVRAIGVRALAANIVNNIVGSGIFVLPAVVAAILGPASIVAYVVCAVAIGLVVVCFAEVGSRVSVSGGVYAYVERAFGPYVGFVTGVIFWFGGQMIASAATAVVLVGSVAGIVPGVGQPIPRAILLIALYASLALVNIRGVRTGARLVEVVTAAKLVPLVLLVVVGLAVAKPANLAWPGFPSADAIGRASLVLIFAFLGCEGGLTASGEVKDSARTVPRAILLGLVLVLALYGGVQLATQGVLGPDLARDSAAPLAATAERIFGAPGRTLMLLAGVVSTFGLVSGDMLATPRVLFAFARDGFLPARVAAVHPRFRTPWVAIALHALVCCGFALSGTFAALAVLSAVATLLIYFSCALAALQLRRRDVRADGEPFRAPGGPIIPLLACAVTLWLMSHATRAEFLAVGVVIVVSSILYFIARRGDRAIIASMLHGPGPARTKYRKRKQ